MSASAVAFSTWVCYNECFTFTLPQQQLIFLLYCGCFCTVYSEYKVSDTWNGWLTEYNAGLVLSQQFAAVQLVLYFSTLSFVFCLTVILTIK